MSVQEEQDDPLFAAPLFTVTLYEPSPHRWRGMLTSCVGKELLACTAPSLRRVWIALEAVLQHEIDYDRDYGD